MIYKYHKNGKQIMNNKIILVLQININKIILIINKILITMVLINLKIILKEIKLEILKLWNKLWMDKFQINNIIMILT